MKVSGLSLLNGRVTGSHDLVKNKLVHAASASYRWSSSENNQTNAWNVNFSNGNFNNNNKYNSNVVRAVCEFENEVQGWVDAFSIVVDIKRRVINVRFIGYLPKKTSQD